MTKFNSKSQEIREGSAFYKHVQNLHGGLKHGEHITDNFDIEIVKSYKKPLTRIIEEGTFIINYQGDVLDSKNKRHQPKIIRTTITQGGAEMAGGAVRRFLGAGSQNSDESAVDALVVRSVERGVARTSQMTTRSTTGARARGLVG